MHVYISIQHRRDSTVQRERQALWPVLTNNDPPIPLFLLINVSRFNAKKKQYGKTRKIPEHNRLQSNQTDCRAEENYKTNFFWWGGCSQIVMISGSSQLRAQKNLSVPLMVLRAIFPWPLKTHFPWGATFRVQMVMLLISSFLFISGKRMLSVALMFSMNVACF